MTLRPEGWQLRTRSRGGGRGDIDTVAITPTGLAFAIETKTRTYTAEHLARGRDIAHWLTTGRRRWGRNGALPVRPW